MTASGHPDPKLGFLLAEIEMGLTFARLALDADDDGEKRERNRQKAWAAVEAVERFVSALASDSEGGRVMNQLEELKRIVEAIPSPA